MRTFRPITTLSLLSIIATSHFTLAQGGGIGAPMPAMPLGMGDRFSPIYKEATLPRGVSDAGNGVLLINDARPVEIAAELLSRKLGVTVSFEEAALASNRDVIRLADIPGNEGLSSKTHSKGPLVPRNSILSFVVPVAKTARDDAGPARIIQAVLDSHSASKNPGGYRLVQVSESEYSLVGDSVEDESGKRVTLASPLDARVSFPEQERTYQETLDLIYRSAASAANVKLGALTDYPTSLKVRLGANNEVARSVLAKAIRLPGGNRLSWSVRYDPDGKVYGVYLRRVEAEQSIPGQGLRLVPLTWPTK